MKSVKITNLLLFAIAILFALSFSSVNAYEFSLQEGKSLNGCNLLTLDLIGEDSCVVAVNGAAYTFTEGTPKNVDGWKITVTEIKSDRVYFDIDAGDYYAIGDSKNSVTITDITLDDVTVKVGDTTETVAKCAKSMVEGTEIEPTIIFYADTFDDRSAVLKVVGDTEDEEETELTEYASKSHRIYTDKPVYESGEYVSVSIDLPYRADTCLTYLKNPTELNYVKIGSSGCGPDGEFSMFETDFRLKEDYGNWKYKVIAKKTGEPDITLITDFDYIYKNKISTTCSTTHNEAVLCNLLDVDYAIEVGGGCGPYYPVSLRILYEDIKGIHTVGKEVELVQTERVTLENDVIVIVTGAPCGADIVNFRLEKEIDSFCGNNYCEIGETKVNCENDCVEHITDNSAYENVAEVDVLELIEENLSESETPSCSQGCYYDSVCLATGLRVIKNNVPSYCDLSNVISTQKEDIETCNNNYECKANFCSKGACYDIAGEMEETQGLLARITKFLSSLFGFE